MGWAGLGWSGLLEFWFLLEHAFAYWGGFEWRAGVVVLLGSCLDGEGGGTGQVCGGVPERGMGPRMFRVPPSPR